MALTSRSAVSTSPKSATRCFVLTCCFKGPRCVFWDIYYFIMSDEA